MEGILSKLNLGTLIERFKSERVDPETVISASDSELIRLGVTTIGDRIRLRDLCKEHQASGSPSTSGCSSRTAREERLALFNPRNINIRRRLGRSTDGDGRDNKRKKTSTSKSWTVQFVCLADRFATKTPTSVEKQILYKAGLGLKKIKLDVEDDESEVVNKITSDVKDQTTGEPLGFSALRSCGGFEMKQCLPNCRDLTLINCKWSAKALRANLGGGQGKIYLVPIQKSLSTKPLVEESPESTLMEKCSRCNKEFQVRVLRKHLWECTEDIGSDDDQVLEQPTFERSSYSTSTTNNVVDLTAVSETTPALQAPTTLTVRSSTSSTVVHQPNTQTSPADRFTSSTAVSAVSSSPSGTLLNETVDEVALKVHKYCIDNDVHNPAEILRCLQKFMVTGRELEVQSAQEVQEGETNFIMVDRQNILETGLDEISTLTDYRKTLEVQFYNEEAQDYGGPRKEFFCLVLNEIKDTYFENGLRELMRDKYVTIGIILGLSIIQNGNLPRFISLEMLEDIFLNNAPGPCLEELQSGLKKVGVYQVANKLPVFLHLLKPGPPSPLTVRGITSLLQPLFSEVGSNKRNYENAVYSQFIKYLRETASGRRNGVTLAHILQFTTGADQEPVLGFVIHPSVTFVEATSSFIPSANTCIACLKLPHPSHDVPLPPTEQLFYLYDLAFSNAYFGNV